SGWADQRCRPWRPAGGLLVVLLAFTSTPAFAQVLAPTSRGIVVAQGGRIHLDGGWTADGVEHATDIVVGSDRVAVLDALNNEVAIAELATGRTTRARTAETPIAGAFVGRDLYVLARDARAVEKIGGRRIGVDPDPAFLRESNGSLYVYSRATGAIEEISGERVTRRIAVAPFASDFDVSGRTAYLVYPREARIRMVSLDPMRTAGEVAVGAVPVDMDFAGGGTAISARILAVADPSAKRVWLTEAAQSTATAIARGFLRGFLGLGLFGSRSSQFPTGVDRVVIRGKTWLAYDSSSGTLYRFTRSKSSVIAKGVAPQAFAVTADGAVRYWQNGTLVAERTAR
ncbi:MAG TPA: hypothetical protein VHL59_06485, partial [Thermoanaerobaculia bacterium]|nr:hypothetical protein [Thermoanaerobaculia bacterium]